jgi:integrase
MGSILLHCDPNLAASRGSRRHALVGNRARPKRLDHVGRSDEEWRTLSEARSKDSKGGKGEICDFVFSTTGETSISGFSRAKARLDAAIAEARAKAAATESTPLGPWRLHDLRRTAASTLARLGFDTIAIDKLLAHQPTKLRGVAAIYQRCDFAEERERARDAWPEHVLASNARQRERPLDTAMLVVGTELSPLQSGPLLAANLPR